MSEELKVDSGSKSRHRRSSSWAVGPEVEVTGPKVQLTSSNESPRELEWIERRFLRRMNEALEERQRARWWSRFVTVTSVTTGLLVPILAGASVTQSGASWVPWAVLMLSIAGAVALGSEQVFRFSIRWRLAESILNDLLREGWEYAEGQEPYGNEDATFSVPPRRSDFAQEEDSAQGVAGHKLPLVPGLDQTGRAKHQDTVDLRLVRAPTPKTFSNFFNRVESRLIADEQGSITQVAGIGLPAEATARAPELAKKD